jgi:RNA polymerase sigma-70 factor (ECF subfamily)
MLRDDTTERLLIDWRSGDRSAGDRLLHRYVPELTGFFGRRSAGNTEELVQRTLLACTQGLRRFEGRSTFRTYLFGIARNQYLMFRRSVAVSVREPITLPTAAEDGPSQLAAVRQEHVILISALGRVEPELSTILRKYYWEERSLEEIGRELGVPVGTVKSRLARGRASLKQELASVRLSENVRGAALRELVSWFTAREA